MRRKKRRLSLRRLQLPRRPKRPRARRMRTVRMMMRRTRRMISPRSRLRKPPRRKSPRMVPMKTTTRMRTMMTWTWRLCEQRHSVPSSLKSLRFGQCLIAPTCWKSFLPTGHPLRSSRHRQDIQLGGSEVPAPCAAVEEGGDTTHEPPFQW